MDEELKRAAILLAPEYYRAVMALGMPVEDIRLRLGRPVSCCMAGTLPAAAAGTLGEEPALDAGTGDLFLYLFGTGYAEAGLYQCVVGNSHRRLRYRRDKKWGTGYNQGYFLPFDPCGTAVPGYRRSIYALRCRRTGGKYAADFPAGLREDKPSSRHGPSALRPGAARCRCG